MCGASWVLGKRLIAMKVANALKLGSLRGAKVVAGQDGLDREVRWAHVIEIPDPRNAIRAGQLVLTTAFGWPRDESALKEMIQAFVATGIAGVGLAAPKYLEHFPTVMIEEAEASNLPLVEIPWEVRFAQVTQEVNTAIMAEQYRVIERSAAIHRDLTRAALEADTLQDVAVVVGNLTKRSIMFADMGGHLLAHHDEGTGDAIFDAAGRDGRVPDDYVTFLRESGWQETIEQSSGSLRIPSVPETDAAARIVCPIRLKGELVGVVWIIESKEPLGELDMRAAEHAAVVAALIIVNQRRLAMLEARLGSSFLDSILEGHFDNSPHGVERARLLDFNLDDSYRVCIVVVEERLPLSQEGIQRRDSLAERLKQRIHRRGSASMVSTRLNQIVVALPANLDPTLISSCLPPRKALVGIGRARVGPKGVRQSYLEVNSLLPYINPGEVKRYEELLLPRVLAGDAEAQAGFVEDLLGPIRRVRGGDVIADSVLQLAEHGFKRARTAAALGIHPNTLRYRIERGCALAGLDLQTPETRFRLQLAVQLLSLGHKKGTPYLARRHIDAGPDEL
jgi:purine catabolism regulator